MSPATSSSDSDSFAICSATLQIIAPRSSVCRSDPVHLEPDRRPWSGWPIDLDGQDRPERRGFVEALADLPGLALVFHLLLQVAARHVEADGIAVDVRQRVDGRLDVAAAALQENDEFELVMVVLGQRRDRDGRSTDSGRHDLDGIVGFLEEERRLACAGPIPSPWRGRHSCGRYNKSGAPETRRAGRRRE